MPLDAGEIETDVRVRATGDAVPTHFLVAFGPEAGRAVPIAAVTQTDLDARRRWERQREANVALFEEVYADLKRVISEREDFRSYIHELEGRLGLPLSGTPEAGAPAALPPAEGA